MRLRKTSIALATVIAAVAGASAADSASAQYFRGFYPRAVPFYYAPLRAPQPGQTLPGATSRPSNRDMRGVPPMGGRGMRGGRMNGGMGGRR